MNGKGARLSQRKAALIARVVVFTVLIALSMGQLLAMAMPIGGEAGGTGSVPREVGAVQKWGYDYSWPIHMTFQLTGVTLAIITICLIFAKKHIKNYWYKAHWITGIASIACLLIGFSIAYNMIAVSGPYFHHFEVNHSKVGIVALTITIIGVVVGLIYMGVKPAKKATRKPHIWVSWIAIVALILTVSLGLYQILYKYPGYWK